MSKIKQNLGKMGENLAADFLLAKGFVILERNYRTPSGEIDLVARLDDMIVFVEVKTRTSTKYGLPEEAITLKKRAHMIACAEEFIQSCTTKFDSWRLDVISILLDPKDITPQIEWFENAIS